MPTCCHGRNRRTRQVKASATIAFQASGIEGIKVRLTTKGSDADSVDLILSGLEQTIRAKLDDYIFGVDDQTMESVVLDLLRTQNKTLAITETLTAGFSATRLNLAPGSESTFLGGQTLAGVDLLSHGLSPGVSPASPEAAMALAEHARTTFGADIGLAAQEGPSSRPARP